MQETYLDIMQQSLKKKLQVLKELMRLNELQKATLVDEDGQADEFDKLVEDKSALINQLEQLDSGFEKLYERVKEELQGNREAYAEQIRTMQGYIREITDCSVQVQAQEARNRDLMVQKLSKVKQQARQIRANSKATANYYQSMMKTTVIDPQFLDDKK